MTKYDRLGFLKSDGTPEIETWGVGSEMLSLKDDLKKRPRCLLVGFMGDSVWDRELTTISRDLKWKLRAGQNLTEMRLATNFVYIPAAFIGAQNIPEINAISKSNEMRPWTLFNEYDRPICRRTLEEAGVPRNLFGQKKRAAGVYFYDEGLMKTMTPKSYQSYMRFIELHEQPLIWTRKMLANAIWKLREVNERARKKIYAIIFYRTRIRVLIPIVFPETVRVSRDALSAPLVDTPSSGEVQQGEFS